MSNTVQSISLEKLTAHPDNPNQMSNAIFSKLLRNIEASGRYEPLIVRPSPEKTGYFQIINGHHRCKALAKLGHKKAACIIWDIDDAQADILLATLNRLGGRDDLGKKLKLLERLAGKKKVSELSKFLPHTTKQLERLIDLKRIRISANISTGRFAIPLVFFVSDIQKQIIEKALSLTEACEKTKAAENATALTHIAQYFLENSVKNL